MAFSNDNGGFEFACDDAKFLIGASTWNTRLSQIARIPGPIHIMTGLLPDPDYISQILGKRPHGIFIIAHTDAESDARLLKLRFPAIRIALHGNNNAKIVIISPETTWVSSSDFGKTRKIESAVGIHSVAVYERTLRTHFNMVWAAATEI